MERVTKTVETGVLMEIMEKEKIVIALIETVETEETAVVDGDSGDRGDSSG